MSDERVHSETDLRGLAYEFAIAAATLSRWSLLSGSHFGDDEQRARSLVFLPVIGLVAGAALPVVDRASSSVLATTARSIIVFGAFEVATGAIDLLGIADTAEALRIG